jgi:hypothetical protein
MSQSKKHTLIVMIREYVTSSSMLKLQMDRYGGDIDGTKKADERFEKANENLFSFIDSLDLDSQKPKP